MELLLVLAIVLLVFGVGRVSKIGHELGQGIRGFREGIEGKDPEAEDQETNQEAA